MRASSIIQYCPYDSRFFVIGTSDVRLYRIDEKESALMPKPDEAELTASNGVNEVYIAKDTRDGGDNNIHLEKINATIKDPQSIDWSMDQSYQMIAVGCPNGRTVLCNFTADDMVVKEFVSDHSQRKCNCVAFNPLEPNLIAVGLDKLRNDYSTIVWDTNLRGRTENSRSSNELYNVTSSIALEEVTQRMSELNNAEGTVAVAWLPSMGPKHLATGTRKNWLRIYDLRVQDSNGGVLSNKQPIKTVGAHANRSVQGVKPTPLGWNLLATYSEDGLIKIWDVKNLREPVHTIQTGSKELQQVEWCPTRSGVLASISSDEKEENVIKIWDLKDEPGGVPRSYKSSTSITSISWHPRNETKLLSLLSSGSVAPVRLHENIPLTISSTNGVAIAKERQIIQGQLPMESDDMVSYSDISVQMRSRALRGYGSKADRNLKLTEKWKDRTLQSVWRWIVTNKSIFQKKQIAVSELIGVYGRVNQQRSTNSASTEKLVGYGFTVMESAWRTPCHYLVDWAPGEKARMAKLARLEASGQVERAITMAVFMLDIRKAIEIINRQAANANNGMSVNFAMLGVTLASMEKNMKQSAILLRETCERLSQHLTGDYLPALFAFISSDRQDFSRVLASNILLEDKVLFALRYLSDSRLTSFVNKLAQESASKGNLNGLLLTGINANGHGVSLLQNYLDRTSDIQTVACVLVQMPLNPKRIPDKRPKRWVDIYRSLLNSWQLWADRARFDVQRSRNTYSDTNVQQQVYAKCTYCKDPYTLGKERQQHRTTPRDRRRPSMLPFSNLSAKAKLITTSCPSCNRPLPRCTICSLPLECVPFDVRNRTTLAEGQWTSGNTNLSKWFCWCQTCKHGGHVACLTRWFDTHTTCPVPGCNCKCMSL